MKQIVDYDYLKKRAPQIMELAILRGWVRFPEDKKMYRLPVSEARQRRLWRQRETMKQLRANRKQTNPNQERE